MRATHSLELLPCSTTSSGALDGVGAPKTPSISPAAAAATPVGTAGCSGSLEGLASGNPAVASAPVAAAVLGAPSAAASVDCSA
eukprot:7375977-Prymnesium_polylepis.2